MNILVILAHPTAGSFNHSIAHTAVQALQKRGHKVVFHDLYAEKFDPVLPSAEIDADDVNDGVVERHCQELAAAEGIVIVHPNWWGQPPAVLKGWVDRVFRAGGAYRFDEGDSGEGIPVGLLKVKAAVVFNTANTCPERERKSFGDPLETTWRNCIFGLCGVENVYRRTFSVVITSTEQQRQSWLREVEETIKEQFKQ